MNKDGILEKVEGDENQPITQGRLCMRCLTLTDFTYHPDRVIYPMKRAKEDRGKNKWERIHTGMRPMTSSRRTSQGLKEKYGPESIVVFGGTGREGGPMCGPYGAAMIGTPNACYTQSGYACYIPRVAAGTYVAGVTYPEMTMPAACPDAMTTRCTRIPEVMITWGKERLPSNGDGFFGHAVIDVMKRGSKLISIDPRSNWLSTRAVYHLQLRPGTDTALGMAMLNIIISEDLYDHDFVDKYCYGFEQLAERVKTMTPEMAAEICDLDVDDIYGATRMYACADNAAILWGLATDQKANGTQSGHTIIALEAITGNLDIPGGQLLGDVSDSLGDLGFGWKELGPELQNKIIGLYEYPAYVGMVLNSHADLTLEAMETGEPYEIHGGFIVVDQPARRHLRRPAQALARCHGQARLRLRGRLLDHPDHPVLRRRHLAARDLCRAPVHGRHALWRVAQHAGCIVDAVKVGETKGDLEIQYDLAAASTPAPTSASRISRISVPSSAWVTLA